MRIWAPDSVGGFREAILGCERLRVSGAGTGEGWLPAWEGEVVSTRGWTGVSDYRPADLMVTVRSGTLVAELEDVGRADGLGLPLSGLGGWLGWRGGTVGGLVGLGLPHWNEAGHRGVKDWVTGMTVMLADGRVVTVGSRVAKSVAGFDLHRTMVGSRGGLGVVLDVTLRLVALSGVREGLGQVEEVPGEACWVSRFPLGRFGELVEQVGGLLAAEPAGGMVWSSSRPSDFGGGWGVGPRGVVAGVVSAGASRIRGRLKETMDPGGRLVEGYVSI